MLKEETVRLITADASIATNEEAIQKSMIKLKKYISSSTLNKQRL